MLTNSFGDTNIQYCKSLIKWIYKDLTLSNLDKSYERALNKMLLGLYHVHQKTKSDIVWAPEIASIYASLREIDPDFQNRLQGNTTEEFLNRYSSFFRDYIPPKPESLKAVFQQWEKLQQTKPELFTDLDKMYHLDKWDKLTVNILDTVSNYSFQDSDLKQKYEDLGRKLNASTNDVLGGRFFDDRALKRKIDEAQESLMGVMKDNYQDILNDYENVCSGPKIKAIQLQESNNLTCPIPETNTTVADISLRLNDFSEIINSNNKELLDSRRPDRRNIRSGNLVDVHPISYRTNPSRRATYCKRDPNIATMVVIHHTATQNHVSPHTINRVDIDNSEGGEPWYMIGYNYLVSNKYQGATPSRPKVFEGRGAFRKGAHAGGYTARLSRAEKTYLRDKTVLCGNEQTSFRREPALNQVNSQGGLSGNLASFGIAIIGNYTPVKYHRVNGVLVPVNINQSEEEYPSEVTLDTVARLACDLQKKYPRTTKIVPHDYFKQTDCPGHNIRKYLGKIRDLAANYGCNFKVVLTKAGDR